MLQNFIFFPTEPNSPPIPLSFVYFCLLCHSDTLQIVITADLQKDISMYEAEGAMFLPWLRNPF